MRRYRPEPEEKLLKAFQVLDVDNKGYLTQDEITNALQNEGMIKFLNQIGQDVKLNVQLHT